MAKANLIPVDLQDSTPDNTVGGFPDIPDDEYLFETVGLDSDVDDNSRRFYKVTAFVVNDCPYKSTTFTEKFTFPSDAEDDWSHKGRDRFHAWLLAIGYPIAKKEFGIDPAKVKGLRFWSRTYHHKMPASEDGRYEEKLYSRLGPFRAEEDDSDAAKRLASRLPARPAANDDDDDDEDVKPTKISKKAKVVDDDDDEDELSKKRAAKVKATKKAPVVEDDDDEEEEEEEAPKARRRRPVVEDDDEEEEEEEAPKKKAKPAAKPAAKSKKAAPVDDDDDDDEEDEFPTRPLKNAPKGKPATRRRPADDDDEDD